MGVEGLVGFGEVATAANAKVHWSLTDAHSTGVEVGRKGRWAVEEKGGLVGVEGR